MDTSPRVLVLLATYNERENLPALLDAIGDAAPEADILVVDDNSPDGTGAWVAEQAAARPRLALLSRQGKLGLGTAVIAGLRHACEHDYDHVVNLDADFSHHPRHLPELLAGMRDGADVMIGSRYTRGGRVEGWPWTRRLTSRGVNWWARWWLGLPPRDCSGSYRCYRVATLRKLDWNAFRSRGYSFFEEVLWRLKKVGARFGETPITFIDREKGRSKVNPREALAALRTLFWLGLPRWLGGG